MFHESLLLNRSASWEYKNCASTLSNHSVQFSVHNYLNILGEDIFNFSSAKKETMIMRLTVLLSVVVVFMAVVEIEANPKMEWPRYVTNIYLSQFAPHQAPATFRFMAWARSATSTLGTSNE